MPRTERLVRGVRRLESTRFPASQGEMPSSVQGRESEKIATGTLIHVPRCPLPCAVVVVLVHTLAVLLCQRLSTALKMSEADMAHR